MGLGCLCCSTQEKPCRIVSQDLGRGPSSLMKNGECSPVPAGSPGVLYLNCGRDRSSESWSILDRPSDTTSPLSPRDCLKSPCPPRGKVRACPERAEGMGGVVTKGDSTFRAGTFFLSPLVLDFQHSCSPVKRVEQYGASPERGPETGSHSKGRQGDSRSARCQGADSDKMAKTV